MKTKGIQAVSVPGRGKGMRVFWWDRETALTRKNTSLQAPVFTFPMETRVHIKTLRFTCFRMNRLTAAESQETQNKAKSKTKF